jgi:histidine triad (HIT) family protein
MNVHHTDDFYCDMVFSGKVKVKKVKETGNILAFQHTRPSWETHIVIVPKEHIPKLTDLKDMDLIKEIFQIAREIIIENNWDEKNYRIITNGGEFQDSKHLHFHLISGEKLK